MPTAYQFRLELFDQEHRAVHEVALAMADFHRAIETAFFDGLRRGLYQAYDAPLSRARVEPRFEGGNGSPRAAGFDVVLPGGDGEHRVGFNADFFDSRATRLGLDLVREKKQPDDWRTFNTQSMLGGSLLSLKKYKDAEPLLLKGYEGMKVREKAIPPQAGTRIPEALDRLIELYTATDRPAEAKKWRAERAKYSELASPPPEK